MVDQPRGAGKTAHMGSIGRPVTLACGMLAVGVVLLSPAVYPESGGDVLLAGALPAALFASGAVAGVLRPAHIVGHRLLQAGLLHLVAVAAAVAGAPAAGQGWPAVAVGAVSATLFALGFVALLDLLARYPDGEYGWGWTRRLVLGCAVGAPLLVGVSFLGSARVPSVIGVDTPSNPAHVAALAPLAGLVAVVALLPILGFGLLLARYPRAPRTSRLQMRGPLVTTAVVVAGLVTTALAERLLGPVGQSAVFVAAGAAWAASFLVGLLRHSEELERLTAAEASRARIAQAAADERARIERDLHDGAQQQLIALLTTVELARVRLADSDAQAADELEQIAAGIAEAHRDLRALAHGIHPATLTDHGLAQATRSALARMPGPPRLSVAAGLEHARFPAEVEAAAYLFLLEALTNAVKHAGDLRPEVTLGLEAQRLVITVSDAGTGLSGGSPGALLTGLSDRLAAADGELEVDRTLDGGTVVRGSIPVGARAGR